MMKIYRDQVQLCKGNACVKATGQYAEIITAAAAIMLLMIGLAALAKAAK